MIFYHQGNKKKSNELGVASGCLLFIGFGAIIFFFTLLDDIDDLIAYFLEKKPQQVTIIEETYHKHEGPYITVKASQNSLYYDLESGKYTIKKQDEPSVSFTPDVYDYDANYKLGKPLFKKK